MNKEVDLRKKFTEYFIFFGFGMSGAAALIYEVVWTRSLSTIMGSSTYALSTMLAAFMAGLSIGGWMGGLLTPRIKNLRVAFALCELGIGIVGLATIPAIKALTPLYIKSFYAFHLSFEAFSVVQFIIVFMIMGIPTTLMGLTFPFVVKLFSEEGRDVGTQAGRLYGINTFGAIIGAVSAGFLLIPLFGVKWAAVTAASLNIFTASMILFLGRDKKKLIMAAAVFVIALPVSTIFDSPVFPFFSYYNAFRFGNAEMADTARKSIKNSNEKTVLYHNEGIDGDVSLIKYKLHDFEDELALINNGKQEAGDAKGFALLAFLPYFSHAQGSPVNALNIGLGSGHTLSYLSGFPLEHIDSVELSEGIIEVNKLYLRPELFSDPRINHVRADGRNYLLMSPKNYDIIIASPSWAVELASAGMLTDEFFELAKSRLSNSGVFAVWVDFFMMPHEDLETVMRTFAKHFNYPAAWYVEGDVIILTGSNSPVNAPERIMASVNSYVPVLKDRYNIATDKDGFDRIHSGRINTDNHPVIEFHNARNIITWRSGGS